MRHALTGADSDTGSLENVPVARIRPNPDNPRLTFRQGELDELQESIRRYGIQVPIAVFRKGNDYVLIDGERRWRCASKLNLRTMPALVRNEPDPLQNLLLMFNIHALREQWDLLTIALKLPKIVSLLRTELSREPTEKDLAEHTGLSRGVIRRCRLLTELPDKYKTLLLGELKKPQSKRTVGEDFFIELERSLKTVERAMPGVIDDVDVARQTLLKKYQDGLIDSNIEFRKVAKIARAHAVGADPASAQRAIKRLVSDPKYTITRAWKETVSEAYAERDIVSRIDGLTVRLQGVSKSELDEDALEKLEELVALATSILEGSE